MPPKSKKTVSPVTHRKGTHKSRRKPQPPPEHQDHDLASQDESSTMQGLRQTLGDITAALVTMSTRLDTLQDQAKSVAVAAALLAQPGPWAGGNPMEAAPQMALVVTQPGTRARDTATASPTADMEQSLRHAVEQRVKIK